MAEGGEGGDAGNAQAAIRIARNARDSREAGEKARHAWEKSDWKTRFPTASRTRAKNHRDGKVASTQLVTGNPGKLDGAIDSIGETT